MNDELLPENSLKSLRPEAASGRIYALGNGVFTRALLDVLQGKAGRHPDGSIHITSLGQFLTDEVKQMVPGQRPMVGAPIALGDFPIFMPR
jgi:hypothetical protein